MARLDRLMQEARRHLGADEMPVVCVPGREAEGRRHQLVLLTDRRVLVTGRRGDTPIVIGADIVTAAHEPTTGMLHLTGDGATVRLREVENPAATLLVDHLRHRQIRRPVATPRGLRLLTA